MKLCTVCGVVTSRAGSRCTTHARQSNRSRHNALYSTRPWQQLSARVLRAWRGEHGNWCPGYGRLAHPAADLTVDHVVPLAAGGAPLDIANTSVLCRSCNSTKGASTDRGGVAHTGTRSRPDREVALGGELLGRPIEQGDVLYLALEDGKRRGQTRLRAALGDRGMPRGRLEVRWSAAKLGEGLEAELVDWLDGHPGARLVALDTLQRVRARGDARRNAYEVDVEDLARLQDIFKDRAVGLLIVHHSKKDAGDDFLASVSGTYGITGSADTTLVIQRKRLETFGKLVVTGRDVQEVEEPVQFNGMTWSPAPRSLAEASFERAEVYKVIEADGPIFPQAIAERVGSTREAVKDLVAKLVASGSVARVRGGYVTAGARIDEEAEVAETPETSGRTPHAPPPLAGARTRATTTSTTSASYREIREEGEVAGTRVRGREARDAGPVLRVLPADPNGWANPCHWYSDHQFKHRQTPSGWTCDACYPEEGPA